MAERYSISNRKSDDNHKSHVAPGKQAKEKAYTSSTLSTGNLIIVAAIILVVTNVITLSITVLIYRSQISHLNQEINDLKNQLEQYKKTYGELGKNSSRNKTTAPETGITVPNNTQQSVQNALNAYLASGGTDQAALQAALAGSLNQNVIFAVAGSSASQQTLAQAIASLNYLKGANGAWNWNLSPEQLNQYRTGPYAQYFGDNAIIGQTTNGYVASFTVDSTGKVTQIFVSSTTSEPAASTGGTE